MKKVNMKIWILGEADWRWVSLNLEPQLKEKKNAQKPNNFKDGVKAAPHHCN